MRRPMTEQRAQTIVRQFHRYEAYFAERGVDRRRFLRMIAAGSAAATVLPVLVACGAASDDEVADATATTATGGGATPGATGTQATGTQGADGTPTRGGTILIGSLSEAQTINPLLTNETESQWRCKMIYDEFVELNPVTLEPRPNIAENWELSGDGKEYTFTIRQNVTFHDGKPLTAEDIAFTFHGIMKKEVASPFVPRFLPIVGAEEYNSGSADRISGIEVVDDHTLKIRLTEPYAAFLANLRWVRPLPKHLLDGKNLTDDAFYQSPIGAGPFKFKSWTINQDFVAERHDGYWQEGKPYLDGFTHRAIPDNQTLVIALATGQIEGSLYALPTQAEELRQHSNLAVIQVPPGKDINGWGFGQKNNEVLRDVRVRRAIIMAIDTETFVSDFLLGLGRVAVGPVPSPHWAFNKNLKPLPYDPAQAKQLIDEAGVSGATIRAIVNAGNHLREDWLTFSQQSLAEIGITLQPDIKEWTQVVKEGTDGTYEISCPIWSSVTVDPDELFTTLHSQSPRNVSGYANSEVDDLLEQGRVELDMARRKEIYGRLQEILIEDAANFWAWDRPFIDVTTTAFHGYEPNTISLFQELEDWWKTQ